MLNAALSSPRFQRFFFFLVLLIVAGAYWPSLQNGFVHWDDQVHLTENPAVRGLDLDHLKQIFTTTLNETYLPLTVLSFAVEYHFAGYHPFVYHFDSLVLHLLVTFLVMILARRFGLSVLAAGLAGLIFGLHPLHVEPVAWVTARKDVLYGTFYLLSVLAYLDYLEQHKKRLLYKGVFWGFLSVLAKSMALSLPLVLFILDWFFRRKMDREAIVDKIYYAAFIVPVVWVSYVGNAHWIGAHAPHDILVSIWCYLFYLVKFIAPFSLGMIYQTPYPVALTNPAYWATLTALAFLAVLIWLFRRDRLIIFALLFYTANIFFLLRFTPVLLPVNDRFMYLASVGLCFVLAVGIEKWIEHARKHFLTFYAILFALALLFGAMMAKVMIQSRVWDSSVTLWENQLQTRPSDSRWFLDSILAESYFLDPETQKAMARIYEGRGTKEDIAEFNKIIHLYHLALQAKPKFAPNYYGLARVYDSIGDRDRAIGYYYKTLDIEPWHYKALAELTKILKEQHKDDEADALKQRADEAIKRHIE